MKIVILYPFPPEVREQIAAQIIESATRPGGSVRANFISPPEVVSAGGAWSLLGRSAQKVLEGVEAALLKYSGPGVCLADGARIGRHFAAKIIERNMGVGRVGWCDRAVFVIKDPECLSALEREFAFAVAREVERTNNAHPEDGVPLMRQVVAVNDVDGLLLWAYHSPGYEDERSFATAVKACVDSLREDAEPVVGRVGPWVVRGFTTPSPHFVFVHAYTHEAISLWGDNTPWTRWTTQAAINHLRRVRESSP